MTKPRFTVYLEKGINGFIIAECPELPGCLSQGKTVAEAKINIQKAIRAYLKVLLLKEAESKKKIQHHSRSSLLEKQTYEIGTVEVVPV